MRTTELSFQEVLEALVKGTHKEAIHENSDSYLCYNKKTMRFYWDGKIEATIATYYLTNKWSLHKPIRQFDEVEVVSWAILTKDGSLVTTFKDKKDAIDYIETYKNHHIIKLTGTDRVLRKEKTVHKVTVDCTIDENGDPVVYAPFEKFPETYNKAGKLIFEWKE